MKKATIISVFLAALFFAATVIAVPAGSTRGVSVKISLDSTYLLMGNTTALHVELSLPAGVAGQLHAEGDTLTTGVEIASLTKADTTATADGGVLVKQDIVIQSFDSGNYVIPPVIFISAGGDTASSNSLALKVVPVNVDSLSDIHDYAPVATVERGFWDWLPSWWGWALGGIILLCGALAWYFLWYRRKGAGVPVRLRPAPKPVEPHVLALRRLRKLHDEKLCENGHEKEFYTRLTEILREYIDTRFHINAMEMTSEQILRALRQNDDTRLPEMYMRQILKIADYVKFAKMRPFSEDNVKAYNDAVKFVEDTKPQPPQPQGADGEKGKTATDKN